MCVAIAGRACLLILHRVELDDPIYPELVSIVVYPGTYRAKRVEQLGVVVTDDEQGRLGESWQHGLVVLSWDAAVAGAATPNDGHDVVLHEFAHQLDAEDGGMDGAPILPSRADYGSWARVFGEEFQALRDAVERGRRASIDEYGATNPPEFFAVVTEEFFEQPEQLERRHPKLYTELEVFYRLDPAGLMHGVALRKP
jgi:Mlc titration factor MtfA (ptsG expression regulator)